jgi:hypothetical protein
MELLIVVLVVVGVLGLVVAGSRRQQLKAVEQRRNADLAAVVKVADEDVTRFGEELQRLDTEMLVTPLDEAMRQDYQRALDSYESAKDTLRAVTEPDQIKHVTEALEDGRYSMACVLARRNGEPLPVRRPPCFFNPAHGPSTTDIEWAPHAGVPRQVPVCAADADRVAQGAEPDIRMVREANRYRRVPYWQAGPAYSPWASGYYGAYAASNLLPTFMVLTLLSPAWDGSPVEGADTDFGAGEASGQGFEGGGYDGGGGGYDGGGDYGGGGGYEGGDYGGGLGGGFDGGGFDAGGIGF